MIRVMVHIRGNVVGVREFTRVPCLNEKVAVCGGLWVVDYVCHDVDLEDGREHAASINLDHA